MKFSKILIEDIERRISENNSFDTIVERLKNARRIGIWGTGLAGTIIFEALRRLNINVEFFMDNDLKRLKNFACKGNRIIENIRDIPSDTLVIIACNVIYGVHNQLEEVGHKEYLYIDPGVIYYHRKDYDITEIIKKNSGKIDEVYEILADDDSRKVYKNVLLHRAVHDLNLIWDIYDKNQYFGNRVIRQAKGCFVGCGAFQGDTLRQFLKQVGNQRYKYFAFEADHDNYQILKQYCEKYCLKEVYPINLGVWNKKEQLFFQSNSITGEVAGKISDIEKEGMAVSADSIDHVLADIETDFIKMDIEGAEIKALEGAKETILKNEPVLAISAYHELEHLWEIPIWIKEINSKYRIYFGHHMWNAADTVCYALMK